MKSLPQHSHAGESNLLVMLAMGRMFGYSAGYPAYNGPRGSKATQIEQIVEIECPLDEIPPSWPNSETISTGTPAIAGKRKTTDGPLGTAATFGAFRLRDGQFRSRQSGNRVGDCRPLAGDGCTPCKTAGCFEARTLGGPGASGFVTIW